MSRVFRSIKPYGVYLCGISPKYSCWKIKPRSQWAHIRLQHTRFTFWQKSLEDVRPVQCYEGMVEITDHGRREPPCFHGLAEERPTEKNVEILRNAAEAGYPEAQCEWGKAVRFPPEGNPDLRTAFSWFLQSGNQGYPEASLLVGISYFFGLGVEANREEAKKWLLQAAKNKEFGDAARVYLECMSKEEQRLAG